MTTRADVLALLDECQKNAAKWRRGSVNWSVVDNAFAKLRTALTPVTDEEIDEVLALDEKRTPEGWSACKDGACKCGHVMSPTQHVATIVRGDWGDSRDGKKIDFVYGHVPDEQATANAQFIAAAPRMASIIRRLAGRK